MKQIKYIQPTDDVKKSRRRNRRLLMIFASLSLGVIVWAYISEAKKLWVESPLDSFMYLALSVLCVVALYGCVQRLFHVDGCSELIGGRRQLRLYSSISLLFLPFAGCLAGSFAVMFREFPSCFWGGALLSLALFISEGYVLWKHFMGEHFLVSVDGGNFAPGEVVEVDYAYPGRERFDELKVSLSYVINSDPSKEPIGKFGNYREETVTVFATQEPSRLGLGRFSFVVPGSQYPECLNFILRFETRKRKWRVWHADAYSISPNRWWLS